MSTGTSQLQDEHVKQSDGEPTGAHDSALEDGAETDPDGSESEGVMDDETSSQVQTIEVDDISPGFIRIRTYRYRRFHTS